MTEAPVTSSDAAWIAAIAAAMTFAIGLIVVTGAEPDAPARHVLLVPVAAAAARWGFGSGLLAGLAAAMLEAPFVLPYIEREGLTQAGAEGLLTLLELLLLGALVGVLAGSAARKRTHERLLHALQRALARDEPLGAALERVRLVLMAHLGVQAAIVLRDGDEPLVTGDPELASHPMTTAVLATATAAFVPDTGGGSRPRRLAVVPVVAREGCVGALAAARAGELGASERAHLAALGSWIGLALENARLAARQRRFADELTERIATVRRELEALNQAKSRFVATASHELRTPLTALRGFSELLACRRYPAEDVHRFAAVMLRETERLARLIENLLDLSRLERGLEPALHRTLIDVGPSLEAALAVFAGEATRHRIVLDCAPDLPRVAADVDALDRVVQNLVSNAVKYAPPGIIRVTARATTGAVEIVVEDRGPGIPPEMLPRIFEPYFRVDDSARTVRGTGIGLAVVKALVEAHGGTIQAESEPGTGTRFCFALPTANGTVS